MSSFLGRYFDAEAVLPDGLTAESIAEEEIERISRRLAVVIAAGSHPRRLGGDASSDELALDKRRARRVAHALKQALFAWTDGRWAELPDSEETRQEGSQIDWLLWGEAHDAEINERLRVVATWSMSQGQEAWGKHGVVLLENERDWINYALRG